MVTFEVDSLDFSDDEEARFGAGSDFATRFSSANDALEIADVTNGATATVPRGTSTDLVGGKFAETVSEGKALADDGNVYDTIQGAVDAASSWVKVGPGTFNESVTIDTAGLTLEGSGERTIIIGSPAIDIQSTDITIQNLSVESTNSNTVDIGSNSGTSAINLNFKGSGSTGFAGFNAPNCTVANCSFSGPYPSDSCIVSESSTVVGCSIENSGQNGIKARTGDCIIAHNQVRNTDSNPLVIESDDAIVFGNRTISGNAVLITGVNVVFVNNMITGSIDTSSTSGSVVQDNLITEN